MILDLARESDAPFYPDCDVSSVTLAVPTTPESCSLCGNRRPVWFVAPAVATNTEDLGSTPLGAPDACKNCLNELIAVGTLHVMNVDPDSF